jgi:hypothetical protein
LAVRGGRHEGALVGDPVEAYFAQLRDIHASGAGVAETSYYNPLANLLTSIGHGVKPKVTAIINLRNTGGGIPDGGLFTASQLKGWDIASDPLQGQLPARGAIEVKSPTEDVFVVAASEQVARYVERYGLVLVTNLRDFVLVGRDAGGTGVRTLESCRLAGTETGFWAKVLKPQKYAGEAGEGLTEFLRRVVLHNAPLSDPKDLAWFLASYARTARLRLESRRELPALDQLRSQLEESLGLKFEGDKGDHFFRSTLVQTLFYGMFASWVLWAREKPRDEVVPWDRRFQWETASQTLHVPMVAELFYQFSNPGRLRDLHIDEVLEWAEEVLWRIDRPSFFAKFQEAHAVQYFYEPFLEAFDPQMRKELGVWYTPDEVVKYMVARVDWALREELGIADGLADPSVVVLDPCCGTGAYLVEVLRKIDETLQAKGADALTRQDVKRAAMDRVIGFEIMPAPFVIAHLQMGILLAELGVPLKDADERAAVYLTNALTGWGDGGQVTPPKDRRVGEGQLHSTLLFPEFAEERDAADRVKREEKILVVIGNPPYNSYGGTSPTEEAGLVEPYKEGLARDWGIKKFNLDDLYVRFFRLAERQIAERTGRGLVCLISNFSWTGDASFVVMRKRLLAEFDSIWIDNLNGDSRETGKLTPEGAPDPSVFSTPMTREGIRVGTSIALLCRSPQRSATAKVRYRDFWGASKRSDLVESLDDSATPRAYEDVTPSEATRFALRQRSVDPAYAGWPALADLSMSYLQGLDEDRGFDLMGFDRSEISERIRLYMDPNASTEDVARCCPGLTRASAGFEPQSARARLLDRERFDAARVVSFQLRPLDERQCYWTPVNPIWKRPRPDLWRASSNGNSFVVSRPMSKAAVEGVPFLYVNSIFARDALRGHAVGFAVDDAAAGNAEAALSTAALRYLTSLGIGCDSPGAVGSKLVWGHVLAIGFSPEYLRQNAGSLKVDWPHVPMPSVMDHLARSSTLGWRVASLLDSQAVAPTGDTAARCFGPLTGAAGQQLNPSTDLAVTARWAIAGQGGITMPSTGKLTERAYSPDELTAIADAAQSRGLSRDQAIALLGETCFDVYLNDVAYWRCVPANVWRYTIGGYQVIKKWLSYRERALLGRDLKPEEARYVTEMVRRIAALVLMQPELDANYERVKADVWEWKASE